MNTRTHFSHPLKATLFGLLGLVAVGLAITVAGKMGLIDVGFQRRALGLAIGVMVLVTGNFLPKMRPLNAPGADLARATAAERLAGWILVLAGIADLGLFVFATLDQARFVASVIGIGAIVVIAINWAWLAWSALSRGRPTPADGEVLSPRAADKRRLAIMLLLAFFYILATACAVYLLGRTPWVNELMWWMTAGFLVVYAALSAWLAPKRSSR